MSHRQTRMERAKAQPSPHRLSIPIFAIFRHLAAACAPGKTSYFWRLPALATAWF
jgi:hypothetical protein